MESLIYDTAIIGSGPAGFTAAIYTCRSRLKTLLFECFVPPSQVAVADFIENYPGFPEGIEGFQLLDRLKRQAQNFGLELHASRVDNIALESGDRGDIWRVKTEDKIYYSLTVILAVGARHRQLGVEGEDKFRGKGVSYCAVCDGAFFKDKEIVVIGGGNSAVSEALYLTRFAKKVRLIHRRNRLRAVAALAQKAEGNRRIELVLDSVVTQIYGKETVQGVRVRNVVSGQESHLSCCGVFISVGYTPNTNFLGGLVKMNDSGYIVVDQAMRASKPGIFACGDCRSNSLRQIIAACGDGAVAGSSAVDYVDHIKGQAYE